MLPRLFIDYFGGARMQHFSNNPDAIHQTLLSSISSLFDRKEEFLYRPETDFSRTRKISFEQTLLFPMIASSENVPTELLDFFGEEKLPSPSAMIQRRSQIKPEAFEELFFHFTSCCHAPLTFHGYRLFACDGSRLNLPYNPSDQETYLQCISGRKGINQLHMNVLYDLQNEIFLDAELQPVRSMNEKAAFCRFLSGRPLPDGKAVFLADRGYASYNNFACAIHNDRLFLIRVPESFARKMAVNKEHWLERNLEDEEITVHIGRCKTRQNQILENYHHIPSKGHYDFIERGSRQTDSLKLRVLKFPISDQSYEYIVTNLPAYAFSLATIKELYHLRWGVETAFRHLKYAASMVRIHSLKKEFLIQEIYAKLTLYNFASFIKGTLKTYEHKSKAGYKYVYNHTQLLKICIRFLLGTVKNVAELVRRNVVPVRLGRGFERNLRRQSADSLNYR